MVAAASPDKSAGGARSAAIASAASAPAAAASREVVPGANSGTGSDGSGSEQAIEAMWRSFFLTFAPTAESQDLDEAASFLTKACVKPVVELSGNTMSDLEAASDWPTEVRPKAILRKAHKNAVALNTVETSSGPMLQNCMSAAPASKSAAEEAEEQETIHLVGDSTANALTVSRVLRRKHEIDIEQLLLATGLGRLGFFTHLEMLSSKC